MIDLVGMSAIVAELTDHGLGSILSRSGMRVYPARDAAQVLDILRQRSIDIVFADVLLPGMGGTALLRQVKRHAGVRPGGVLTCVSNFPVQSTEFPLLPRPYATETVLAILPRTLPENRLEEAEPDRIEALLDRLGVPSHPGRDYLRTAIAMAVIDPRLSGKLSKRLYPAISAQTGASPAQAERAIRHCIEIAWKRGSVEEQYRLFGNTIDAQRGKPTVGEMIARSADIIRLEESI